MRPTPTGIKRNGRWGLILGVVMLAGNGLMPNAAAAPLSSAGPALADMVTQAKDPTLDKAERVRNIRMLGRWASPEVREPLIALLKDPLPEIRSAAAKGLGWPGNTVASPALRERVSDKTEQADVRLGATEALVKIGDPSARELILELSRDPNPKIREEALKGLLPQVTQNGEIVVGPLDRTSDRLPLATRAVEDGELTSQFRADAIRVLVSTKDPAVIPTLVKILETGPRLKIESPPPNATQQQMLAVRYQQIGDLRAWAARGLGELDDRSMLPKLVKATEDPDDFFLRYLAAGALVGWRAREALPAFLRLLDDPAPEVRAVAAVGVGTVGTQANVDRLAARLGDSSPDVRVSAADALATIGGDAARQRLKAAIGTEAHPQVQQVLEAALARLKR